MNLSSVSSRASIADHHPNVLSRMADDKGVPAKVLDDRGVPAIVQMIPPMPPSPAHLAAMTFEDSVKVANRLSPLLRGDLDRQALASYIHTFSQLGSSIETFAKAFPQQVERKNQLDGAVNRMPVVAQLYLNGQMSDAAIGSLQIGLKQDANALTDAAAALRTLPA